MEPAIPTGSLIYTKEIPPKEVKNEDVIAFTGARIAVRSSPTGW